MFYVYIIFIYSSIQGSVATQVCTEWHQINPHKHDISNTCNTKSILSGPCRHSLFMLCWENMSRATLNSQQKAVFRKEKHWPPVLNSRMESNVFRRRILEWKAMFFVALVETLHRPEQPNGTQKRNTRMESNVFCRGALTPRRMEANVLRRGNTDHPWTAEWKPVFSQEKYSSSEQPKQCFL